MGCSLLEKWLIHYDPIHRGATMSGIANGVVATHGFSFPRIAGGYNLRRGEGFVPAGSSMIVGTAGADANSIDTFAWVTHAAGVTYTYRLTPIGGGGVENLADEVVSVVAFDGGSDWIGLRPNAVSDLQVRPAADGRFEAAVSAQRRLLAGPTEPGADSDRLRRNLDLYERGLPCCAGRSPDAAQHRRP